VQVDKSDFNSSGSVGRVEGLLSVWRHFNEVQKRSSWQLVGPQNVSRLYAVQRQAEIIGKNIFI